MPKRESKPKTEARSQETEARLQELDERARLALGELDKLRGQFADLHALTPVQQLICDLVSDMLVNGGENRITDQLLDAAIRHKRWRWAVSVYGQEEAEKIAEAVNERRGARFEKWRDDLHAAWRESRTAPPTEKPSPSTAAARIRFSMIERVREQMEEFLAEGTPEEIWTMWDIFTTHDSTNRGSDNFNEFPLAGAIEGALGKIAHDWIKVPQSFQKHILSYLECLQEAQMDDKKEPA
jgi:hypothetical protein